MSSKDVKLSAYAPGLIDVCRGDEGELLFLLCKDGEIVLEESITTDTGEIRPPSDEHLPFSIPRATEVMRYIQEGDRSLYGDLLAYLKRFSALDEQQWAVVAHYVFLTYLHDHPEIDYCPYILFFAVPERGKSRTGKSVSYVAFRGIHLIEMREATMLRYSQHLHGTLFLDLLDVWKKAEKSGCEDILLLRAEKGGRAVRVAYPEKGPFNDTIYYDIYGPTIIATNVELHKILDTRCLPIIMPNHPGNYENPRPELGLELKERLTAWRAKWLQSSLPELEPIDGIAGRLWDISKPLLQVSWLSVFDASTYSLLQKAIMAIAGERNDSKRETTEGKLVAILWDLTEERGLSSYTEWTIKTRDILRKFNEGRPVDHHVNPQWIGKKLKSMSLRHRTVHGLSEIILTPGEYATIMAQYGLGRESSDNEMTGCKTLPENVELFQDDKGVVGSGRVLQGTGAADENIPF